MKLVTVTQMQEIEKEANASGLTFDQMMENAGEGLANVKARKFFLFEDHRGDSFPEQEHGCGRATRAAANNEYVCFHDDEEELKGLCLISRTPRSDV